MCATARQHHPAFCSDLGMEHRFCRALYVSAVSNHPFEGSREGETVVTLGPQRWRFHLRKAGQSGLVFAFDFDEFVQQVEQLFHLFVAEFGFHPLEDLI